MDGRNQTGSPSPGGSNLSPSTYQVNVNRKKTRKWVEAKVQNYDGDDWGAPESDEEDDSPVAPPPPVPRPAAGGTRLPSESRVAGAGRPGQPPVSVPTNQPPVEESVPAVTGPSNLTSSSQATDNVGSPSSEPPSMIQAEPVLLPASTYEQQPKQDSIQSPQTAEPTSEAESDSKRVSVSPQLPNVARMSGFGVDFLSAGGADAANKREPTVQEEREPSPRPTAEQPLPPPAVKEPEESSAPETTLTPPPAQPPLAEPEKSETQEAAQPAQPAPRRPSLPGQYVTEDPTHEIPPTPMSPPAQVNEPEVSPVSEHAPKDVAGSSAGVSDADSQKLQPGADAKSLPPLRTPSPHEPRTVPPPEETAAPAAIQSAGSEGSKPEITPTEPLQPKPAQYTPSDYEAQPLSRQFTADTVTSSPVKESDVLSDEIMRTLTPGGLTVSSENSDDKRKSQAMPTGRESSYTLSGYDDYWADTADKRKSTAPGGLEDVPEVPPVPAVAPTAAEAPEPAAAIPEQIVSPVSDSQASLRRRFSWEALEEPQPTAPAATAGATQATQPSAPAPEASRAEEHESVASPGPTSPASPTIKIVPDTSSISHQVSQASSKPATLPTPEPPSPVSELSDRDATPLAQPVVSPADGEAQPMASPLSSNPVPTSQSEAQTPKIMSPTPTSAEKPIMTFREIMEIPNPKDRIAKYEETRNSFGSQDSGLDNWLTTMKTEYPEHANATGSFSGASVSGPPSSAGGAPGPGGQQPPADQPYYQQYLQANANAPGASASASNTGSARSRIAGYSSQAQAAAGSAFGDGGKQIGTKGKEFMHSAGKMGKGLFSKGKSKLQQAREAREARGDKGENSPPPVDRKPQRPERPERPDRTMSWALNFGGQKSRENGPTPPEASAGHSGGYGHERHDSSLSELSKEPPRLAEPPRFSPFLSDPSHPEGDEGVFWQDTNTNNNTHNDAEARSFGGIPAGGPGAQGSSSQAQRIEPPPNEDSDWVVVPRQSADQHNQDTVPVPTDQNAHHPQQQPPFKSAVVPEDSGIGMASQSPDTRPDAQRHSSFRGLPPIRRNSSFGLSAFDATGDPGRVSPVDDDDVPAHNEGIAGSSYQQQNPNGTLQPHENATNRSVGVDSNATLIGQDSTTRTGRSSMSLSKEPMRFYQPQQQQQQQQQPLQIDTQGQQTHPGQVGHPNAVNPIQRTPPSGWQLEESHLAAPLHVARRRAGTDSSQQQVTYGYDKETGSNVPMSPSSPGAGTGGSNRLPSPQPTRQRTSDVPPSSARRYPDLFRPSNQSAQQRVRANSGGQQQMPGYQQQLPRASQDSQPSSTDKVHEAGYAISREHNEDQEKRKASDIFKSIGGRFKKSNSEERRNSVNSGFERTDTMTSVTSQGQTSQKKKRSSFLPGALRPRASMDVTPPPQVNDPNRPVTQESVSGPDRSGTPQSEKKRSLLGGKLSAAQHKFLPGAQRGSSTSNLANDSNSVGGADSVNSMGPPKKRFSGLTDKAATFAGRFRSSADEHNQPGNMPQDPASVSQSSLPPPPPAKSRGRSASAASAGSHGMAPPPAPGAESDERRGRRGSFQGMMSNLMGRSSSKTREAETQQGQAQVGFVHHHPAAPTQQQYGGQGPYPPMHAQMQRPAQSPQQPHVQNEQPRGSPVDPNQRASRHLSGQFMQPPRPSPLAQESSAASPQSPVSREADRVVSPEPPSNVSERATSPSVAPSEGRVSPMPFTISRKPTQTGARTSDVSPPKDSIASPVESTAAVQHAPSVTSDSRAAVQSSEEVQPSSASRDDPPLSPVKRQPTPHASALFASMTASDEPQPPVPQISQESNQTQTVQSNEQSPPSAAPSGHIRTESATSSRPPQSVTGYAPSREATPVQSPPGPPSAGHPSGSQQSSPAQQRQPEGRFSPQSAQDPRFQSSQQFPLQFMQHRPQGSPQNTQQNFAQQQGPRPGPPQGPQGSQQPPQGFQQGFPQQQGPRPQGAPQGPPGTQPSFQQNGAPQSQPAAAQSQGQESKLKGWKNRMSTQMAQIKAQSQGQEKPQQEGQQGQQPTKESWKDRLANMAPSSQMKAEQPQQQVHGQTHQESWKDRFASMAPSAQVKTQQPQMQAQQPVQAQEPARQNGSVSGVQPHQPQPSQPIQAQQPQATQPPQPSQTFQNSQPQGQDQAPTPAPAPQPAQAKPEKSGWRSRVSGQLSSISAQGSSDKPEKGDKPSTGDKLLGALKRASKPADQPPQPPPKNNQPPHQSQWRPSPVQQVPFRAPPPQQHQGRQHPFAPDSAYGQYAQQAQMRPQQQMPQGQYPQYPPQQQQQPQWQGQQHPGQPAGPHQQWVYQQQMAMQQQQQQTVRPPPEPQYDQVPIPKGYGQVHGEYNPAQRTPQGQPMYQGQMHPQQYQQYYQGQYPPQQMQQQAYYQGGQVPAAAQPRQGQSEPASAVPQGMQQGHQSVAGRESPASPPEQGGFNLPIQGNITPGETNSPQLPMQGAQQQVSQAHQVHQAQQQPQQFDVQHEQVLQRPPAVRADTVTSDAGRSVESGVMGGMGQRVLPPGQPQHGHQIHPQPSTTSMNGQDVSGSASQASASAAPKADISRSTSLNPGVVVDEPSSNNLAIDVEKSKQDTDDNIYDATPRLKQETTGNSQGVSDQSSANETKQPTPEPKVAPPTDTPRETNASPPMELEDTADARMRTLRIGAQEEKIFYDPEGDIPKMSATSYPGQEWNPYGEPEFATDWRDD